MTDFVDKLIHFAEKECLGFGASSACQNGDDVACLGMTLLGML